MDDNVFVTNPAGYIKTHEGQRLANKAIFVPNVFQRVLASVPLDAIGLSAVDCGCGGGQDARLLIDSGFDFVLGIDASASMIDEARKNSIGYSGLKFENWRIEQLPESYQDIKFDVAISKLVMNHISNRGVWQMSCFRVYRALKPGGKFIILCMNPETKLRQLPQYGIGIRQADSGPLEDGAPLIATASTGVGDPDPHEFPVYYWSKKIMRFMLKDVCKFQDFSWEPALVSAEALQKYGEKFWEDYTVSPAFSVITCTKPLAIR